jgi:O-antigen/teichoic acid export membrane protein
MRWRSWLNEERNMIKKAPNYIIYIILYIILIALSVLPFFVLSPHSNPGDVDFDIILPISTLAFGALFFLPLITIILIIFRHVLQRFRHNSSNVSSTSYEGLFWLSIVIFVAMGFVLYSLAQSMGV